MYAPRRISVVMMQNDYYITARLLSQRLISWRPSLPITFIAARYDRGLSVMIVAGRPWRFIARLRNLSAASRSRRFVA